jgi:peroxiredoxin
MRHLQGLPAIALLAAGTLVAGCFAPPPAAKSSLLVGLEAPDFTLEQLDGNRVSLADFAARPILLTFWAQGCRFCRAEAPELQRLYARHAEEGLVVLAVNAWDESPSALRVFAREKSLSYPILLNGGAVARNLYHINSVPTHVWIGRSGRIEDVTTGYTPVDHPKTQERIHRLVNPPPPRNRGRSQTRPQE